MSFLTSVTTWSIRDKFSRLTQLATLLNLEAVDEAPEVYEAFKDSSSVSTNKLSPNEVKQVLELR